MKTYIRRWYNKNKAKKMLTMQRVKQAKTVASNIKLKQKLAEAAPNKIQQFTTNIFHQI